tara:strand:+ start:312 stop:551 length:240 start_codon:yes stop_codon:yes gene_type:complete
MNDPHTIDVFSRCAIHDVYALTTEIFGVKKGATMDPEQIAAAVQGLRKAAEWLEKHGENYQGKWHQIDYYEKHAEGHQI